MSLVSGTKLGPYEILSPLGAGIRIAELGSREWARHALAATRAVLEAGPGGRSEH